MKTTFDDLSNAEIPRDYKRAMTFLEDLPPLKLGTRIQWYYQEDLEYMKASFGDTAGEDSIEWFSGLLIPCSGVDMSRCDAREGELNNWIVVCDCDNEDPDEIVWHAFNKLLDAPNLVKVRVVATHRKVVTK